MSGQAGTRKTRGELALAAASDLGFEVRNEDVRVTRAGQDAASKVERTPEVAGDREVARELIGSDGRPDLGIDASEALRPILPLSQSLPTGNSSLDKVFDKVSDEGGPGTLTTSSPAGGTEARWGAMGWLTGFEPATARSTIWGSNQAEL